MERCLAYQIADDVFHSFYKNNAEWIHAMGEGEIYNILKRSKEKRNNICSLDVLAYPWRVVYVGAVMSEIVFLNAQFQIVYTYDLRR